MKTWIHKIGLPLFIVMLGSMVFSGSVQTQELASGEAAEASHVELKPAVAQKSQISADDMLHQLGRGFSNVVYSPLEIPYRLKNSITREDPVRGLVPGLIKGATWGVARLTIGAYEMLTCFSPHEPYLEPFDTDWLYA